MDPDQDFALARIAERYVNARQSIRRAIGHLEAVIELSQQTIHLHAVRGSDSTATRERLEQAQAELSLLRRWLDDARPAVPPPHKAAEAHRGVRAADEAADRIRAAAQNREEAQRRIAESRARMIDRLQRTYDIIGDIIRQNEVLAEYRQHRESALQRVREGQVELETLGREIENLRAGRPLGDSDTTTGA